MKLNRPRISLSTLLLLFTIIPLAISHLVTSRKLAAIQTELRSYRYQYGRLTVEDQTRPHLLAYAEQENPWKWHAYFPKGKRYKLKCGVGSVPLKGLPDLSQLQYVEETSIEGTGEEKTLVVSLMPSPPDSLKLTIGCEGSQSVAQVIPTASVYTKSAFNSFKVGNGDTFAAKADEPFVIFYQTERQASGSEVETGVVVWIVP